jgi:Isopentenyl transferase
MLCSRWGQMKRPLWGQIKLPNATFCENSIIRPGACGGVVIGNDLWIAIPVFNRIFEQRLENMNRVVILGLRASGKSTLAIRLGEITGLPVIELDRVFWQSGLLPTHRDQWIELQQRLVEQDRCIMDGDLGPYDAVEVRLRAADTILLLDFSLVRCAWRALPKIEGASRFLALARALSSTEPPNSSRSDL